MKIIFLLRITTITLILSLLVGFSEIELFNFLNNADHVVSDISFRNTSDRQMFSDSTVVTQSYILELPLLFIPNYGQLNQQVTYYAQTGGYSLWFTSDGMTIDQGDNPIRLEFVNANSNPDIRATKPRLGMVNYLIGNAPEKWRTNIPTYGAVTYHNLWPGISLTYDGGVEVNRQLPLLKSTFTLAPHADLTQIRLNYPTADSLTIDEFGNLIIRSGEIEIHEKSPIAWQETPNGQTTVPVTYQVLDDGKTYTFALPEGYDPAYPLVIDPATLIYSTYLGGEGGENALAIDIDNEGNIYMTGFTNSVDFPEVKSLLTHQDGSHSVFVTKVAADGQTLIYSVYFGGSENEVARGIVVDEVGQAIVTGVTKSKNFPGVSSLQGFGGGERDAFIAKLSATGDRFIYSTYLGGSNDDYGNDIALDHAGNIYVTGYTTSIDFLSDKKLLYPGNIITNSTSTSISDSNVYVVKLTEEGKMVYGTHFGGSQDDESWSVSTDSDNNVYLTGSTKSTDFPTANPLQSKHAGGAHDAFVVKLAKDGNTLVYSTYLGGSEDDYGTEIVADSGGNAYLTGYTLSLDFPIANALQPKNGGALDAFVAKIEKDDQTLAYSTYLGGENDEIASSLVIDEGGYAYIVGRTESDDFPTANSFQSTRNNLMDIFLTKLNPTGNEIKYSTYLGGSAVDASWDIALNSEGHAYLTGQTWSDDFPTKKPYQSESSNIGTREAFIAVVADSPNSGPFPKDQPLPSWLIVLLIVVFGVVVGIFVLWYRRQSTSSTDDKAMPEKNKISNGNISPSSESLVPTIQPNEETQVPQDETPPEKDSSSVTRILVLAANPKDTTRLRLDEEIREIKEGLKRAKNRHQFQMEPRLAARPRDIQRAMLEVKPNLVHFSGHGTGKKGLVFEDETGKKKLVSTKALVELFKLFSGDLECVILNGCYTKHQAEAIVEHIDYVVGTSKTIKDRAAIEFAIGFYDALGNGEPIEFSFQFARSAILLSGAPGDLTPIILKKA